MYVIQDVMKDVDIYSLLLAASVTKPKKIKNPSSTTAMTKTVKMNFESKSPQEMKRLRSHIAEVCFSITADPSNTFKTKSELNPINYSNSDNRS